MNDSLSDNDRIETPMDPFDKLVLNPRATETTTQNPLCPVCEEPIRPFANQHQRKFICGCDTTRQFAFDRPDGDQR